MWFDYRLISMNMHDLKPLPERPRSGLDQTKRKNEI